MATKSRLLSRLIEGDGSIKTTQIDSDAIGTSAAKSITAASGTTIYSSADTLPVSAAAGDQAFVSSTNRLYIFNGSGWYNIALINSTPYWSSEASSTYSLSTNGAATVITILAIDSEGIPITYTATTDSDFDNIATITKDSDNGRTFTIIPTDSENGTAVGGTGTITFRASDGVNLISTLSTFSITFQVLNSNYTTLLAKADSAGTDNQVDASTNTHTITENGNVTSTALSPYHPGGYSTSFDGVSDYLSFTMTSAFNLTGDFTLECWFNPNALALDTQHPNIIKMGSYQLYLNSASNFVGISPDGASVTLQSANSSIALNTWYHVAIVRSGSSEAMFLNGTRVDTNTASTVYGASSGTSLIGTYNGTGGDYNGTIRDLRLVNGTAIYNPSETTISTPTEPLTAVANTSLLTCHLPYIADGSSNNHTITIVGNTSTKRFSPYDYGAYTKADYGGSVYFDGSGDYLEIPHDNSLDLGNNNFTIEWWMNPQSVASASTAVFDKGSSSAGPLYSPILIWTESSYYVCYATSNGSSWNIFSNFNTGWAKWQNQWKHCAIVRNGSQIAFFLNGVLTAQSTAVGSSTLYDSTRPITINGRYEVGYEHSANYISDFRWIVGSAVYDASGASVGQTVFTPPTEPLTAITNTQLLTCKNNNFFWDAAGTTRLVNQTAVEKQAGNFASSVSYYFDGSGDYIDVQTPNLQSDYTFGKNGEPFTIEFWIKPNSNSNTQFWFHASGGNASWSTNNGHHFFIVLVGGNVQIEFNIGNNLTVMSFSASLINTAAWQHMAWAYDGTTHRVFLNGTQRASSVASIAAVTAGTYTVRWGRHTDLSNTNYFAGYMQDMRVTKGLARYTSNFTPPTAEFEG